MTNIRTDGHALEQIPDGEEEAIRNVIDLERQLLQRRMAQEHLPTSGHPVPRSQHPKHHGCVAAEFLIAQDVPQEFRFGVFAEGGKTFPAWIRFSNARKQDDREPGGHGMAIKLMEVPGDQLLPGQALARTQDFLLLDTPVFFIKNAVEFAAFDRAVLKSEVSWFGKLSVLEYFLTHPHEFRILHQIERNESSNPLGTQYWSGSAYALGAGAVKYTAVPRAEGPPIVAPAPSQDQLRLAMSLHLQTRDAYFDFFLQPQLDPASEPIEDATHLWRTAPQKVATLRIPRQSFDSPSQMEFCENLSFNPWHALVDHRPLGSLNRLRKATYLALSEFRHTQNHAPDIEPNASGPSTASPTR